MRFPQHVQHDGICNECFIVHVTLLKSPGQTIATYCNVICKLRPNGHKISAQHIATSLGAKYRARLATLLQPETCYDIMQYQHILQEKSDHFQICLNNTQHVATFRNTSQQADQTHATCYAQQCCDHLVGTQVSQLSNTKYPNIVGRAFANYAQKIATFKRNIS